MALDEDMAVTWVRLRNKQKPLARYCRCCGLNRIHRGAIHCEECDRTIVSAWDYEGSGSLPVAAQGLDLLNEAPLPARWQLMSKANPSPKPKLSSVDVRLPTLIWQAGVRPYICIERHYAFEGQAIKATIRGLIWHGKLWVGKFLVGEYRVKSPPEEAAVEIAMKNHPESEVPRQPEAWSVLMG